MRARSLFDDSGGRTSTWSQLQMLKRAPRASTLEAHPPTVGESLSPVRPVRLVRGTRRRSETVVATAYDNRVMVQINTSSSIPMPDCGDRPARGRRYGHSLSALSSERVLRRAGGSLDTSRRLSTYVAAGVGGPLANYSTKTSTSPCVLLPTGACKHVLVS